MFTERHDAAAAASPDRGQAQPPSASAISAWCINYLATMMERPPDQIDAGATFASLGMDSVTRTSFMFAIEEWLNVTIKWHDMLERSTIAQLADGLAGHAGKQTPGSTARGSSDKSLGAAGTVCNARDRPGWPQPDGASGEGRRLMRHLLIAIGALLLLGTALWLTANSYFHCCTPPA